MINDIIHMMHSNLFWIVFFLILYFVYLSYRSGQYKKRSVTEYEKLVIISRIMGKSEFNIFEISGDKWEISKERLNRDFRIYLEGGTIPFYVRDFIRHSKISIEIQR